MRLKERLMLEEGCRLKPYKDTKGVWTIGIGRNLDSVGIPISERKLLGISDDFMREGITAEQALRLLENDIEMCYNQLKLRVEHFTDLDEIRQEVLIDMCFNLGINKLIDPIIGFKKMFKYISIKNWKKAADEMLSSKWHKDVGKRAEILAKMMETGDEL